MGSKNPRSLFVFLLIFWSYTLTNHTLCLVYFFRFYSPDSSFFKFLDDALNSVFASRAGQGQWQYSKGLQKAFVLIPSELAIQPGSSPSAFWQLGTYGGSLQTIAYCVPPYLLSCLLLMLSMGTLCRKVVPFHSKTLFFVLIFHLWLLFMRLQNIWIKYFAFTVEDLITLTKSLTGCEPKGYSGHTFLLPQRAIRVQDSSQPHYMWAEYFENIAKRELYAVELQRFLFVIMVFSVVKTAIGSIRKGPTKDGIFVHSGNIPSYGGAAFTEV